MFRGEFGIPLRFSQFSLEFATVSPYKAPWRIRLYEKTVENFLSGPLGEGCREAAENVQAWVEELEPQVFDYLELTKNTCLGGDGLPNTQFRTLEINGKELRYELFPGTGLRYPQEKPFTIPLTYEKFGEFDINNPTHVAYNDWRWDEYRKWCAETWELTRWPISMDVNLRICPPRRPTPPDYPFNEIFLAYEVGPELTLKSLEIMHYARRKSQWLIESEFDLWHGHLIRARQLVKDGTLFPNPKKGRLWSQLFKLEEEAEKLDGLPFQRRVEVKKELKKLRRAVKRVRQGFVFVFKPTGRVGQRGGFISEVSYIRSNRRMVWHPDTLRNLSPEETPKL